MYKKSDLQIHKLDFFLSQRLFQLFQPEVLAEITEKGVALK